MRGETIRQRSARAAAKRTAEDLGEVRICASFEWIRTEWTPDDLLKDWDFVEGERVCNFGVRATSIL